MYLRAGSCCSLESRYNRKSDLKTHGDFVKMPLRAAPQSSSVSERVGVLHDSKVALHSCRGFPRFWGAAWREAWVVAVVVVVVEVEAKRSAGRAPPSPALPSPTVVFGTRN